MPLHFHMQCTIYDNYVKTRNSTARPTTEGTTVTFWEMDIKIKDESSVYSPSLLVDANVDGASFRPSQANYVYIPHFQRFYFVEDIVWFGTGWEIHCREDVLATFRNALLTENCYITRTSCPSLINHKLIDTMFPADNNVQMVQDDLRMFPGDGTDIGGTYIVGIVGSGGNTSSIGGAVAYYTMGETALSRFINYLFTPSTYSFNVEDITQSFFNPMQYIASCKWTPFDVTSLKVTQIRYGWFNAGGGTYDVNAGLIQDMTTEWFLGEWLEIYHPVPSDLSDYRNSSLYVSYKLYLPFIGEYELPTDILQNYTYIGVKFVLDPVSCDIMCEVKAGNGQEFQWNNGKHVLYIQSTAGCDIELAGASRDYVRLGKDVVGAIGNAVQLNFSGALENVIDGIAANQPKVSQLGGNGSRALGGLSPFASLYTYYRSVNTISRPGLGQPCGQRVALQDALGYYVQVRNPKFTLSANISEMEEMKSLLEGGAWIE